MTELRRRLPAPCPAALAGIFAVLLTAGCNPHPAGEVTPPPAASTRAAPAPAPAAAPAQSRPAGATLAVAGTLFNGSDPDQISAYLQTVKEIKPIRFDVEWSPQTVAVSKDEAMRALLGVSRDGSTFRFARAEPVVAKIKPGSILWIYDLAVSHVDRINTVGDVVVVRTSPASLTQAFTRADIEFDAVPNLANLYVAFRPHRTPAAAPTASATIPHAAWWLPARRYAGPDTKDASPADGAVAPEVPRLIPAAWRRDADPPSSSATDDQPPEGSAPSNEGDANGDYGVTQPEGNAMEGELMGFEYSLAYTTSPDRVSLQLEARKKEDDAADKSEESVEDKEKEAQKAESEVNKQLKELTDLKGKRLTAEVTLNDLQSEYNREMTKLNSSIADPGDRARAQQAATQQYQYRRNNLEEQILALDKARDAVSKIKQHDEERLKKLAEGGKKLEKLFDIISDNLDVRFRVKADVDSFAVAGALKVTDGNMDSAAMQFKNLKGHAHLDFVGRMGQPGNGAVKVPVVGLPFVFNIPFPIAGFPLVIQLGADFSANVFLAGRHATQQFSGDYEFSGSEGIKSTRSGTSDTTAMSSDAPDIDKTEAMSPGVSGLVLAIQAPRVGVGIGVFGASSVAYVDVVSVITMLNAAAANGAVMFSPLCQRTTYSAVGSVGIDTHIMPVPIPFVDKLNKKLSTRKQVFEHHREVLNPSVNGCEV